MFNINPAHDPNSCNAIWAIPVPAYKSLWLGTSQAEFLAAQAESLHETTGEEWLGLTYGNIIAV